MAALDADRELTSTLHLGLRSVVGNSPADVISDLLTQVTDEERSVIEGVLAGDANSAMVIIHRGAQKGSRFLISGDAIQIGKFHLLFIGSKLIGEN